jgi:hypothetical protein
MNKISKREITLLKGILPSFVVWMHLILFEVL